MRNGKKNNASTLLLFVFLTFFTSCFLFPGDHHHPAAVKRMWDGYKKAEVINYAVDGCSWMIKLEDGTKLQPLDLQQEFKKNNLKVWIKYEVKKGNPGVCMAGEMITINAIELRKKNE
jgi:hypothetical protein